MNDWTKAADIKHGVVLTEPAMGDVWIENARAKHPETALAWVCDLIPFEGRATRVCLELAGGGRITIGVDELRKRFTFRKRA